MARAPEPSYLRSLWYKWRSLRLPWRKRWLCGFDLQGNTYWEFRNELTQGRPRRVAKYPSSTHYGDVQLAPAWLQWLRHTREQAPSVEEQELDLHRQESIKQLAAAADARWRAKERYIDSPDLAQATPQLEPGSGVQASKRMERGQRQEFQQQQQRQQGKGDHNKKEADPWAQHYRPPSDGWQPEAWAPSSEGRR